VKRGLDAGTIKADRVDDAVRRILRVKLEMGLFEHSMPTADRTVVGSAANRALAAEAVAKSAVLLRTSPGVLPLSAGGDGQLLLAGDGADDLGAQLGGWSITWQGGHGATTVGTTLKAALEAKLPGRVAYEKSGAFAAGTHAPAGVVVVAEPPYAEGRGDSADLALAPSELDVVDRVRPLVDHLVVVVVSGRPVMLDGLATADAIVEAWLPGTEGEGLVDVLTGATAFSGVLPVTWPSSPDNAPRNGKAACDGAIYPFGYGLKADGTPLGPAACGAR
jgi:beta-glucosidase